MQKRQDIELLRIASAFGIVWFHSAVAGRNVGYAGLVAFLTLSVFLAGGSGGPDAATLYRRTARLMVPWLFWFTVYGTVNIARGRPLVPTAGGSIAGILVGPSVHLWYMPFIFLCLVALDVLKTRLSGRTLSLAGGGLAVLVLAATPLWRAPSLGLVQPAPQWAHASAAVFAGVFLLYRGNLPRPLAGALLAALFAAALGTLPYPGIGLPYSIGLATVALVASGHWARLQGFDLRVLSECTPGIYFIHVLVLGVLSTAGGLEGFVLPVATFGVSALVVMTLRRAFPRAAKYWS